MSESKVVQMKLLINSETKRVLFAEAGKECVDFLFHILSLPMATVIKLLREQLGMVGSIANLYESLENLNETYIQPDQNKDALLKPKINSFTASSVPLMFLEHAPTQKLFYRCPNYCTYAYSDDKTAVCPSCNRQMNYTMTYVAPQSTVQKSASSEDGGFVKGVVTYMVMDDLVVTPMSTISSITLLNKFNVKGVGSLQEKVVHIGTKEAVKLLKTSLCSKKVLTDVFLNNI